MHLRLKTKITLIMAFLVLAVVGVNSTLYVATLTRQVIRQANERAQLVSRHVFFQAQNALSESAKAGETPASSEPEDLRAYVQKSLDESVALTSSIEAEVGFPPLSSKSLLPMSMAQYSSPAMHRSWENSRRPGQTLRNW